MNEMAKRKKVVLIIVEGVSDETALAEVLEKFIPEETLRFQVLHKDITTEYRVAPDNIVREVGNVVRQHCNQYYLKASDLLEVIHIVDTDGAFISDEYVVCDQVERAVYCDDCIKTPDRTKIMERNRQKAENVKRLVSLNKVFKEVPYNVYFFSCNLEHVLHNDANVPYDEKNRLAKGFKNKFKNDPSGFLTFIRNADFAVKGSYEDSWKFLWQGTNSLRRACNLNILFSDSAKVRNWDSGKM